MDFKLEGKCVLTLSHKEGEKTSKLTTVDFNLDVSKELPKEYYMDKDDLPTKAGVQALTQCFVQGLAANIHFAHQKEYRDSAEHLRYIISELERAFIEIVEIEVSKFENL